MLGLAPPARVHWRDTLRRFIRWFLVLYSAVAVVGVLIVGGEASHRHQIDLARAQERLALAAKGLRLQFEAVVGDLRFLAGSGAVRRFADGDALARSEIEGEFQRLALAKGWYDQLRLLDRQGMEQVRVDRHEGLPASVERAALQAKGHRYYFSDALRLPAGAVYASPLDLNVEHGVVEQPPKPMIRFATPVVDGTGRNAGVVVLNFLAAEMLQRFRASFPEQRGAFYLLNADGYWLSSPDPADEWRFMDPERHDHSFASRYPTLWDLMERRTAGNADLDGTSFVFARIEPLWSGLYTHFPGSAADARDAVTSADRYYWVMVARYPAITVLEVAREPRFVTLLALTLLAAGMGAWFFARAGLQEELLTRHLLHSHDLLEGEVRARTKELDSSRRRLALLFDSTAEGILGTDRSGRCTFANRAGLRLLGCRSEREIIGQALRLRCNGHDDAGPDPIRQVIADGRASYQEDGRIRRIDGSYLEADIRCAPVTVAGQVEGAVVSFTDISERKQAQQRIRTLSQAVEQSPVAVIITDRDGMIEYVNQSFERSTGYPASEVYGRSPSMLKSGEVSPRVYEEIWTELTAGHTWVGELRNRRRDGTLYWVRAFLSPVQDEQGQTRHFLAVEEDVTLYKQQEERIVHQAHHDFLTGLPNRFLAMDRLELMIRTAARQGSRVAALYLDMDDFKKINDTLGHSAGDELLVDAAHRLTESVRAEDTVARLGGDEFLILLGGTAGETLAPEVVAEHLLQAFRAPFAIGGRELVVTLSVGIALYPEDGDAAADLLRSADVALFQAKQAGRNTFLFFAAEMNASIERRLLVEARLRDALQHGALRVHYQPIVDLADGRPVGAEALLRWHDPELGQVSPAEFIPVAEQTGMIGVIGMYVLAEAMRACGGFRARFGAAFYVSVNVSPPQFRDPDLAAYVRNALDAVGLPGEALVLEVTEGLLLSGCPNIDETLEQLHAMGVRLAMDDFGTGYASLGYLRRYPFDILKIDREFVRDMAHDQDDRELVRAALQMAHALHLRVVAEGVEEPAQVEILREWGCDLGQGYLFGRPCAADELTAPTAFDATQPTG